LTRHSESEGERSHPARPGQRIRDYEILSEIGHGGMGVVYRARDPRLERQVALKCPWPHLAADPKIRQRFLQEARATARVTHSGIVQVYDTFEANGLPWIALELVEGEDLRTVLSRGRPPIEKTLRWGEQLAGALEAAHARNVLHRDVNPRNILIHQDGGALLSDFGLARVLIPPEEQSTISAQPTEITTMGTVLGTPRYMSPEQALGKEVDRRTDLFSLGAVLYELATGVPAFPGDQFGEIFDRIVHRDPESFARYVPETPPELERIILKCLRKSPDDRYPDARALRGALRTLRRDLEFSEYSSTSTNGVLPRPRPRLLGWALGVAMVAAVAAIVWMVAREGGGSPIPDGTPRQVTTGDGWNRDPALSPDGSRIAFASDRGGNSDIYIVDARGGNALRITDSPGQETEPAWFPDGSAIVYTHDDGQDVSLWKVGQMGGGGTLLLPDAKNAAISPDGRRLAFARARAGGFIRIGVATLENPTDARLLTRDGDGLFNHMNPAWSPNCRTIVYTGHDRLWEIPADGGEARPLTGVGSIAIDPTWAPSGTAIVFESHRDGIAALWWVGADGGEPRRYSLGSGSEGHPTFSRDGRRFAYSTRSDHEEILLKDVKTNRQFPIPGSRDDRMPTLAPDGSAVAFVSKRWGRTAELWIQPLENGRPAGPPRRLSDGGPTVSHPAFSPDGRWIACYRIQGEVRDLWAFPAQGGEAQRLTDHPAADLHPSWSPDGREIAFVSDREDGFQIWIVPVEDGVTTGEPRRVMGRQEIPFTPVWSPDGRELAYVGSRNGAREVCIVGVDGGDSPRRITDGASALRVRWSCASGDLWVCGTWGEDRLQCRVIDPSTGEVREEHDAIVFGGPESPPFFDLSPTEDLLAFSRIAPRGHVWTIESTR
jgi:Tol biopolymer transport system component